jgi:hypothetical protein
MPKHPDYKLTCEAFLNAGKEGELCGFCSAKGVQCLGGEHPSQTEIVPQAGKNIFKNDLFDAASNFIPNFKSPPAAPLPLLLTALTSSIVNEYINQRSHHYADQLCINIHPLSGYFILSSPPHHIVHSSNHQPIF